MLSRLSLSLSHLVSLVASKEIVFSTALSLSLSLSHTHTEFKVTFSSLSFLLLFYFFFLFLYSLVRSQAQIPIPCFLFFFVTHPLLISFLHQTRSSERDNGYVSFDYDLDLGCFRNRLEDEYGIWPMKWEANFELKQCLISGFLGLEYVFCWIMVIVD